MRRGLWLTVMVLGCAAPAVDAAQQPADVGYAGQTEQALPGFVKKLPGGAVTAAFAYSTVCTGGDGAIVWSGVARAAVKGGHFHYERKEDAKGPAITLDGRISNSGVSGTWRVHFSVRNKLGTVTDSCDSESVSWSFPRDGAGGQSSQGFPVAVRLAPKAVKSIQIVTRVKCKSGDQYLIPTFYDNFPLRKGRFGRTFSDTVDPSKNRHTKLDISVHGRTGHGVVTGSWELTATFTDDEGKQLDTCQSGPVTWSVVP
jgi:hypothetical protein